MIRLIHLECEYNQFFVIVIALFDLKYIFLSYVLYQVHRKAKPKKCATPVAKIIPISH